MCWESFWQPVSPKFCRFVTAAELVVLLTLYVQGNFLVNHMPPFDGTEIVWGGLPGRKYKDSDSVYSIAAAVVTVAKLLDQKEISGNLYGCECGTFGNPHDNACDDDCDHRGYRERTTYYALENG